MNSRDNPPDNLDELRRIAEEKLRENGGPEPDTLSDMSPEERRRIIHELRTHQIELELQNAELRRAQIELDASRARYFDLYDLAPVGYCTVSRKGLITEANLTAAKLLNTARDSLVKQFMSRFILKQDQDIFYLHRKRLFETGEPQVCELRMTGGNSSPVWVRLDASVSAEEENDTPVCRVVISDITKRKQAEKQLLELNENLEQQVKERTGFAEARARQLRFLTVELIEAEEKERRRIAEVLHDDLQQILASAKLQLQVTCDDFSAQPGLAKVDDLLSQSIKKSRDLSLELSPVVVYQAGLHEALKWLASRTLDHFGLDVRIEVVEFSGVKDESVRVFFFRASQELLFNAAKYSGVKSVLVKLSDSNGRMTITVSDQGLGFDPETLDSPGSGRGIGLLSIRERAEAMGGNLLIESAPGQGSCFTLTIPLHPDEMGEKKQGNKKTQIQNDTPAKREDFEDYEDIWVLIVEDQKVTQDGLGHLLKDQPHIQIVGEAADGLEAIGLVSALDPDVVLMDISMPKMGGVETTRQIREKWPEVRVIGLSMNEDVKILTEMRQAGAEQILGKTASFSELLKAIYGI